MHLVLIGGGVEIVRVKKFQTEPVGDLPTDFGFTGTRHTGWTSARAFCIANGVCPASLGDEPNSSCLELTSFARRAFRVQKRMAMFGGKMSAG